MINEQNYEEINKELAPFEAKLVAVSKTKPISDIKAYYEKGQRIFGENYVQELVDKYEQLPKDIQWHFIGHLQTKKVKYIAPFIHLIHGVDSIKLIREIDKRAKQNNRVIDCLLQFHIAEESSKFGLDITEAQQLLTELEQEPAKHIRITGVMGMATFTDDVATVEQEFKQLAANFDLLKNTYFKTTDYFSEKSMGMSGDYKMALKTGSTLVRIGSKLFGARN